MPMKAIRQVLRAAAALADRPARAETTPRHAPHQNRSPNLRPNRPFFRAPSLTDIVRTSAIVALAGALAPASIASAVQNTTNETVLQAARDEIWQSWRRACAENADWDALGAFYEDLPGRRSDWLALDQTASHPRLDALNMSLRWNNARDSIRELTELLEQISGSAQHKDEYERLEREKTKAENQASYAFQKKKLLVQERTNVAKQKKEAEEYAALQKGLKETRRKLELLRLFHLEKEVTERKQLAEEEAKEAEEVAAKQEEIELLVRTHEKEMAAQRSLVVTSERKAVDLAKKVDGRSPEQIQLQAEIEQVRSPLIAPDCP
jgi:hypothetical protein